MTRRTIEKATPYDMIFFCGQQESHPTELPARRGDRARSYCRRSVVLWTLTLGAHLLLPNRATAQPPPASLEYRVKLAFLYNYTRYFKWPKQAFANDQSPVIIGVYGPDPFGGDLDALEGRTAVGGRRIVIKRVARVPNAVDTHILFFSAAVPSPQVEALLQGQLASSPTLIVCESPGMAVAGAPVNFYLDHNGTVGFELNLDAIKRRGLQADAQLLNVATVVDTPNRGK